MNKKPYIAGNWKMNMLQEEGKEYFRTLLTHSLPHSMKVLIAPPFTLLPEAVYQMRNSSVLIAGQNIGPKESGAYTGEVSARMLVDLGVQAVILGHSERRTVFHEEDQMIAQKLVLARDVGLDIILCVGETEKQRDERNAEEVVSRQLESALQYVEENDFVHISIAYEPIWAIGTGKTAQPEDAELMHAYIRKHIGQDYSRKCAEDLYILYGGSVNEKNAKQLLAMDNIDGALIGGASLKVDQFLDIINMVTV